MKRRGLLIFDLDGTLFRTDSITVPLVQQAFRRRGLGTPTREEICDLVGKPASEYHAWVHARCPGDEAEEIIAEVDRGELKGVTESGELFPGARPALEEVRALVSQMAICSNGPRAYVERVVTTQGLRPLFDLVRYRMEADRDKSGMVGEILGRLGARPAIVIGDRRDDVEAAHANGIHAIAAGYGYGPPEELVEADAWARSPAHLPSLVRMLLEAEPG
jgi:phosphoglycolate phosphatase-like HAD superfamily hydrolase